MYGSDRAPAFRRSSGSPGQRLKPGSLLQHEILEDVRVGLFLTGPGMRWAGSGMILAIDGHTSGTRWGAQKIRGNHSPTSAGIRWPCSHAIQRARWTTSTAPVCCGASPAAGSPPCRATGGRSRSTGRSTSSIGDPRPPTSCCRGGDGLRERYCSQKEKAHSFLLSVRHSHGAFGRACPIRVPVGSPRKSAAIIPFVNKTLTSGLPIGSIHIWSMNRAISQGVI